MNQLASSTAGPAPGIGHNQPIEAENGLEALTQSLGQTHCGLVARFLALELGCLRVPDPIPGEEDARQTTDFIAQCQVHIRDAEAAHKKEKVFFLKAGRAVDAFFKRRCEKLTASLIPVIARLKSYSDQTAEAERERHEIARRASEEDASRAMEEAVRHRATAELLARGAMNGEDSSGAAEHLVLAEEAMERARIARVQTSSSPEPARIRGDYGATAYVTRTWSFEIIDLDQVPRKYVSLDVGAVKDAINKDRIRNISGLRIFRTEMLRIRGA